LDDVKAWHLLLLLPLNHSSPHGQREPAMARTGRIGERLLIVKPVA